MEILADKKLLLGVTGGIASYKSVDLVRRLRERGAVVRVAMSGGATGFVTPLTFQAVSGLPVHTELLDPAAEAAMGHIELARWADAILIAPASANFIARLAHGFADELLTTLCLASEAPIAIAPAMNRVMWAAPATVDNLATLRRRGVAVFGPAEGDQACGEVGAGRMLEPLQLVEACAGLFGTRSLNRKRVMITAGPTREAVDPVRFISNHSSGKMGYALAEAAARAGARVTLVSGPVALATPHGVERVDVVSAADMHTAVMQRIERCDLFIACAAVADYRPRTSGEAKLKKDADAMTLELIRNPDILSAVAALPDGPFTVGFAAETHDLERYARGKLERKGLDMIAANWVGREQGGFNADSNALEVYWPGGAHSLPSQSKASLARELIELIARRYRQR